MPDKALSVLAGDMVFTEGPRWRDGKLWFVDMEAELVKTVDLTGTVTDVVRVEMFPSGLGWLPSGEMLIVSMQDRKLLKYDGTALAEHADLSSLASFHCNDMVVDAIGRAYVGNFGFDLWNNAEPKLAEILVVEPDGRARVAATDLIFPNGTVITPDGKNLIVGESGANQLTAFDIAPDGDLSNRRVWASTGEAVPDGICLDADGAIWIASPQTADCLRIAEGGEVLDRVEVRDGRTAYACMLGGPERKHLFVCTSSPLSGRDKRATDKPGRIEVMEVDVPGDGLP